VPASVDLLTATAYRERAQIRIDLDGASRQSDDAPKN
jgi:hypothetical protein